MKSNGSESIRAAIARRIDDHGMNAGQLSEMAGVTTSRSQLYRYVTGETDLTGDKIDELLTVLGLAVCDTKPNGRK